MQPPDAHAAGSANASPPPPLPKAGPRAHNPYDLLGQADDLHARVAGLQAALDHNERLATLGTIAGLICHEFNNILTPVLSYAQMALARPEDRDLTDKALRRAIDGTERAAGIAAAILGFVREDSTRGQAPDRDAPRGTSAAAARCTVLDAVHGALSCLAREAAKDGIDLVVEVPVDLECAARGVALQHVLLNLILNARGAMLPRGGRLTIRAWREAPAGAPMAGDGGEVGGWGGERSTWNTAPAGWVVLEVCDTGRGMSPEELARVFQPFYTSARDHSGCCGVDNAEGPTDAHTSNGDRRRGTGLGMTICQRLIADCGGSMGVQSQPGRGTTVRVVIPAVATAETRVSADT